MSLIGVYGGTFDPPHIGHIKLAREFVRQVKPDRLIVIPAGIPPHKTFAGNGATSRQRYEMCRLAFGSFAEVSDREIIRDGRSYTVDTLNELKCENPDSELWLLLGDDMIECFRQWYKYREILSLASLAAADRTGESAVRLSRECESLRREDGARIRILDFIPERVSSTEIRSAKAHKNRLTAEVYGYIKENGLYE